MNHHLNIKEKQIRDDVISDQAVFGNKRRGIYFDSDNVALSTDPLKQHWFTKTISNLEYFFYIV